MTVKLFTIDPGQERLRAALRHLSAAITELELAGAHVARLETLDRDGAVPLAIRRVISAHTLDTVRDVRSEAASLADMIRTLQQPVRGIGLPAGLCLITTDGQHLTLPVTDSAVEAWLYTQLSAQLDDEGVSLDR